MRVVDEKLIMNWGLSPPSCIILGTHFSGNYKLTSKLAILMYTEHEMKKPHNNAY